MPLKFKKLSHRGLMNIFRMFSYIILTLTQIHMHLQNRIGYFCQSREFLCIRLSINNNNFKSARKDVEEETGSLSDNI